MANCFRQLKYTIFIFCFLFYNKSISISLFFKKKDILEQSKIRWPAFKTWSSQDLGQKTTLCGLIFLFAKWGINRIYLTGLLGYHGQIYVKHIECLTHNNAEQSLIIHLFIHTFNKWFIEMLIWVRLYPGSYANTKIKRHWFFSAFKYSTV